MKKRDLRELIRMVATLVIIAVVCAALLGGVNAATYDRIAEITAEMQAASMREVLPDAQDFEDLTSALPEKIVAENVVRGIFAAKGASGAPVGYAVLVAPRGFGGEIEMTVGIDASGSVTGVVITELSETPGLGAKADDPAFLSQFAGKNGSLTVVKGDAEGNQISAITGATITSRAVTTGVLAAMNAAASVQ